MHRMKTGLIAGLITAVMTTGLNLISRAIGLLPESMDLRHLAEWLIDPFRHPAGALILGSVLHVIAGGIIGLVYALLVKSFTPLSGVRFMLSFWLLLMLVVLPLAHRGFWGIALGLGLPISTLVLHIVFGLFMGAIAKKLSSFIVKM